MPNTVNESISSDANNELKSQESSQALITVNKKTGEVLVKDSQTGKILSVITTNLTAENKKTSEHKHPLPPDEFCSVLRKIDALGLTWSSDRPPLVVPKNEENKDAFLSDEFEQIQVDYPTFPRELAVIISYVLTGNTPPERLVGSREDLEKKSKAVQEIVITADYRSEFFFKHAIKVPYLENIDWEVVFKLSEKNVQKPPGNAYALLSLIFHDPSISESDPHKTVTVAVNIRLVNKLIKTLKEVKEQLNIGQAMTQAVNQHFENKKSLESENASSD